MRYEFWERRLLAIVDRHKRLPHEWGKRDCIGFAAECVWALTQKNPADPWRGQYSGPDGARRIIAEHGGLEGLIETGLARAGIPFQRIPPLMAQRGDPCLLANETGALGAAVGICLGSEIVGKSVTGLEYRPLSAATVAWAIR